MNIVKYILLQNIVTGVNIMIQKKALSCYNKTIVLDANKEGIK